MADPVSAGERNFLPIVAIIIVIIFAGALAAGAVVWRHQRVADSETRASPAATPETPVAPAAPAATSLATATATATATPLDTSELVDTVTEHGLPQGALTHPPATDPTTIPNAQAAIARLRPGFRSCYNKGLATNPTLHGSITLAITIAPNGDVTNVTKKSGGLDPDVDACMIRRARSATFDATPTGATISVPLQFTQA